MCGSSADVRARAVILLLAIVLFAAGCQYPDDVDGTLDRVRDGGTLRVGVSEEEPYVILDAARPRGVEVRLVTGFAAQQRAGVRYERGGEESLVERLHGGELDIVIGGVTSRNPAKKQVAPTRPYAETSTEIGGEQVTQKHVMFVRAGENAMLVALERYLLNREEQIRRMLAEAGER